MSVTLYLVMEDKDRTTFSMPNHPVAAYPTWIEAQQHADSLPFAVVRVLNVPTATLRQVLQPQPSETPPTPTL